MVIMMSKFVYMKGLEFVFELVLLFEKFIGDLFWICQVFNNLLSNVFKFIFEGYIKFLVDGCFKFYGIYELEIKIEDMGIGISCKDCNKLFNVFF